MALCRRYIRNERQYGAFGVMVSIRDCGSLDTGSTPVLLPKTYKTGSRGMVLSRLFRIQEHVGSNPAFPTKTDEVQIWFNYDGIVKARCRKSYMKVKLLVLLF